MAEEIVWVSPGMLETNVMVAPNSPSALAKHNTMPAMTPDKASGKVTDVKTLMGEAPSVVAACSSLKSTASKEMRIGRTSNGKPYLSKIAFDADERTNTR